MKTFTLQLKEENYPVSGGTLTAILADEPFDAPNPSWKRPAVLVIPGGAYAMTSKREGEPIALDFLSRGFHAFILHYQTVNDGIQYPEQLLELVSAVDCIKKNADAWRVNPDEVFVIGFSAGGHLVGNLSVAYQDIEAIAGCKLDCKPAGIGLGYPVISQKYGYTGTHDNLLNGYTEEAKAELYPRVNLDEAVTEQVPPTYLWATATDQVVPVKNTLCYALALAEHKVPYELHVFTEGAHGISSGSAEINSWQIATAKATRVWIDECANFFRRFVKEEF